MSKEIFSRTELLIGGEAIELLHRAHIAIFGVGGVGGYAVEALARSGIGYLTVVDSDCVAESNLNRQIIALHSTIGRKKTEVIKERIADIDPDCSVTAIDMFYLPENADSIDLTEFDYIVDAIDTVTAKMELIERASELGVPIISSMGAGNKIHPEMFEVADIYKTSVCPLAKVIRGECRRRGIKKLKVVYSKEIPMTPKGVPEDNDYGRHIPGSTAFAPAAAGLLIASTVVQDLLSKS